MHITNCLKRGLTLCLKNKRFELHVVHCPFFIAVTIVADDYFQNIKHGGHIVHRLHIVYISIGGTHLTNTQCYVADTYRTD